MLYTFFVITADGRRFTFNSNNASPYDVIHVNDSYRRFVNFVK